MRSVVRYDPFLGGREATGDHGLCTTDSRFSNQFYFQQVLFLFPSRNIKQYETPIHHKLAINAHSENF